MYYLLPPFIALWLGDEYVMSETLLILVLISFALSIIRGVTEEFSIGYGLFSDVWSPFAEAVILIVVAILGGSLWGLEGTLLGSIVSTLIIIYIWKPYFLFSRGFKLSVLVYWRELCKYIISIVVSFYLSNQLIWHVPAKLSIYTNWFDWVLFAALVSIMFLVVSCCCLLIMTRGTRCLVLRIIKR